MGEYVEIHNNIIKFMDTKAINKLILTEDEIGCALRAQLLFEQFLFVYLDERIEANQKRFFQGLKYFDQRLMVAVAFGLPIELADALKAANKIRNGFGHDPDAQFQPEQVKRFTGLVNAAPCLLFKISNVEETEFHAEEKGNIIRYGAIDAKTDFACSAVTLIQKCANWLISDLHKRGALRTTPAPSPFI
ncbi:hypothetical protein [Stutzerimonas nitrititolerans]|uniref:hypothetical protein n=1 Tax=Stutzerimonas nitrititolerans TaxID=2482751 RepID=UPI0028A73D55|nr:hypothetical protein [Stutzerimonas nitrititolerans]